MIIPTGVNNSVVATCINDEERKIDYVSVSFRMFTE